jgi:hypothetical protein
MPRAVQPIEILTERRPADVELDVALPLDFVGLHLIVQRPHRAFAEHFERHALLELAERSAIGNEGPLGVAQHVDEAGCDDQAGASTTVFACAPAIAPTAAIVSPWMARSPTAPGVPARHRRSCRRE